ncbi:MAG: hypothetical protein P8L85_24460, partial [Rubripirellula sp.]|nr:hypothetical protein [Rubripirellula sp.]
DDLLGDDLLGDDLLGDDLLGDDLLGDDLLSQDSSLAESSRVTSPLKNRFDAERLIPAGGWYLDELRMAVHYRGGGTTILF